MQHGLDEQVVGLTDRLVPGTAQQAMYAVGVIEVAAGLLVAADHAGHGRPVLRPASVLAQGDRPAPPIQ